MKRRWLVIGLVWACAAPVWSQEPAMTRTITVTGQAEVSVPPDTVQLQFGVEHQASTAREAMERTNRAMEAVLERVRRAGVPANQIRTAMLHLEPVYEGGEPGGRSEPRLVGYRARNTVTVLLKDVARAGPVLDASLEAGANRVLGIQFRIANDLPPRLEALQAATTEARAKAQAIARSLDLALGRVESVSESASVGPLPQFEAMAMARGGGVPVQPGEITVRGEVTIRYRIGE